MRETGRKRVRVTYQEDDADFEAQLLEQVPAGIASAALTTQPVVEKILGRKFVITPEDGAVQEMFLIKWRGLSFIHASWEFRQDVERIDHQGKTKLKRFLLSPLPLSILGDPSKPEAWNELTEMDEDAEYYNPEYSQVHRVISCDSPNCIHSGCSTLADMQSMSSDTSLVTELDILYLVKWRGMQYSDSTWERWQDIKDNYEEIFDFWKRQRPKKVPLRAAPHPSLQEYHQLVTSPKFGAPDESTGEDDDDSGLTLRDYQLEGVNWLLWNWWHKRPCILADEMGLGKTIQTVCFLHQLQHLPATRVSGPFLVVAPLSLIQQWQNEIGLWSPNMNCVILHGSAQSRQLIFEHEFYYQEPFTSKADVMAMKKSVCKFDILLSTYEIAMKEAKALAKIHWKVLIVDEAHRLKNQTSRLFEAMQTIPRDQCVLLTGTPLQNKTEELWALLHFADSSKFASQEEFVSRFGDLQNASDVAGLHTLLKPYLLRRVKEDVEKSLPPKEETIVEVALTSLQKQFYRAIYEKNTAFLFKGAKANNQPSLMNVMMELRKCCNHPFLIKGVEERMLAELPPDDRHNEDIIHQKMVMCAGKMVLLDKLLPRLFAEGHKVLIFSQMVKVLNIIEDYLRWKGYSFERLDGSTRASDRHTAVERFCRPSLKKFIMLLSTKAGGLGLNLTSADTVIIFDSDWNPHNDIQAQARAHRIGQTKAVMVYRLLTRKTYEMHMFHRASLKLGLDRAVLAHARNEQELDEEGGVSSSMKDGLQAKEIDELLKRGAYDIFRDDDTEQTEFVEADIDAIMQRSAHKISYEGVTANSISNSLGGFSKATFVSANEQEDVDINDPDFWKKAVGLDEPIPEDPFLDLPMQRKRKQTQVFGDQTVSDQQELDDMLKEDEPEESGSVVVEGKSKKKTEPKPKEPKECKPWGPHSRDRVLRALLQFGFGRWGKIKKESGASQRPLADVESFVRSYMMQCGISAGESETIKGDTEFVHEAIRAAQNRVALAESGEREPFVIPPILQEEKFIVKLRTGGRKMLQKLDLLSKLTSTIGEAVEKFYALNPEFERYPTLDEAVAELPREKLLACIPLGTVRPAWTRPRSWWDIDCDRQLVLGIFIYGYGRYNEVRDDQSFVFHLKLKDWLAPASFLSRVVKPSAEVEDEQPTFNVVTGDTTIDCSTEMIASHFKTPCGREGRVFIPLYRFSEYKGVYSQPGSVKWMAQYGDEKSSILVGTFDNEVEAALAYDDFARSKEGEDAIVNFNPANDGRRTIHELDRSKRPPLPWHRASKFRGVRASGAKWTAQISYDGTNHHLGTFTTEIEAAMAYDCAARDHHGLTAVSNFNGNAERILNSMSREVGVVVEFSFSHVSPKDTEGQEEGKEESNEGAGEGPSASNAVAMEEADGPVEKPQVENGISCPTATDQPQLSQISEASAVSGQSSFEKGEKGRVDAATGAGVDDGDGEADENGSDLGEEDNNDDDKDDEKEDKDGGKDENDDADAMPDARILNRLFAWLVTSDQARLTKQQQEQRYKANKKARQQEMAEKKEERAKQVAEQDRKQCILIGEKGILSLDSDIFDANVKHFAHKKLLLRKCETVLRKPVSVAEGTGPRSIDSLADDAEFEDKEAVDGNASEKASDPLSVEGGAGRLSDDEVRRLSCALLLYGAPFEEGTHPIVNQQVLCGMGMQSFGHLREADSEDRHAAGSELKAFTWEDILGYAGVNLPIDRVQNFYTHDWLPFCVAISKWQTFSNAIFIPNPLYPPANHSIASKGLCAVFIQRQRQLRAMRLILSKHLDDLIAYMRTNSAIYTDTSVPVWWCPWIHDVAMMVGCVKHGFLALEQICKDDELPFTTDHLLPHVKRTFLFGSSEHSPAAWQLFDSPDEAMRWAKCAVMIFPHQVALEVRLSKILVDMTKYLPVGDMCRITRIENEADVMVDVEVAPLTPLNRFLTDSAKRRRLHVTERHVDALL